MEVGSEFALFALPLHRSDDLVAHNEAPDVGTPGFEIAVRWDDPAIGIDWPVTDCILSDKDVAAPLLADLPDEYTPEYVAL